MSKKNPIAIEAIELPHYIPEEVAMVYKQIINVSNQQIKNIEDFNNTNKTKDTNTRFCEQKLRK